MVLVIMKRCFRRLDSKSLSYSRSNFVILIFLAFDLVYVDDMLLSGMHALGSLFLHSMKIL